MSADRVDSGVDNGRRHFLLVATTVTGVAGAALTAIPFLASWKPSARAQALGAPVEADISKLEPGAMIKVNWRGQAIFIVNRSAEMRAKLDSSELTAQLRDPESKESEQPPYAKNSARALNPEYLVLVGVCTHLGCAPMSRFQPGDAELGADWPGGFYCPCHGSKFDLSGRVFKDVPAPLNLKVPPYRFINEGLVQIGVDAEVT
jgi:ubiquinol-cytochrome c reductase iron-sulfur subunit